MFNLKKIKEYLKSPEMRIFWLFLFLVFLILIIDIINLDLFWTLVSGVILASVGAVMFLANINSAKASLSFRSEKSRVENIIAAMNDGVIIYDPEFTIQLFNSAAETIFNLRPFEIIGKKMSPESVRDPKTEILAKVIFQSLAPLVIRQSADGVYPQVADVSFEEPKLELRVTTDRILNDSGQAAGFLKIIRDRTREVELLKSKSDFITVAAHQLRTPLSAVGWALQSLQKEPLNESQKELANTGFAASNNLLKIVEDLLNVSKIEEGKFGYDFKKTDLIQFLQSALDQASPVAKEYQVKIYMEPPKEASMALDFDPDKLILAISNLLENSIKYNIPSGQVVVSVERLADAPFVQVNIKDTGLGIPKEAMDKLFTKFFRADNALTKETTGSGLGLYIVKNIINRHGGQVWAESEIGRGTIFHFTLPTDSRLIPQKEIRENF